MTGRSRTGCLTCRQRKLKCDEERPVCGQCHKASRECVPSTGIVFRHQQNASMNSASADDSESLKGFYAYKNTFEKDSTWLRVPKRIKFIVNADPEADLEPDFSADESPAAPSVGPALQDALLEYTPASNEWSSPGSLLPRHAVRPHGLEALSAAASDQLTYLPPMVGGAHHMRETSTQSSDMMNAMSTSTPHSNHSILSSPDNGLVQAARHLAPAAGLSPPIDPVLERSSPVVRVAADLAPETDHETAFLLRHFAEGPGQWMDLYDLGNFFAHYITVKAISNPLLKHAAAAYAAKQLGRVKGRKAIMGGLCSRQARMEQYLNFSSKDWEFKGAQHYDKAISLLMEVLKDENPSIQQKDELDNVQFGDGGFDRKRKSVMVGESLRAILNRSERTNSTVSRLKRRKISKGKVYSDEMAAATAILCNYEFLDGSGAAWSRHLDGTKSLLDIAEGRMVPLLTPFVMPRPNISKARRATFWNFARQDMLSALINETSQTRLDTEDLPMWKDAGLLLDANGYIMPSNTTETGYPEGQNIMKEDMISNGLVWLIGKIINYCVAADTAPTRPEGAPQPWEGINQHTLMEKWNELQKELQIWADGLPDTFKPCAEIVARAYVAPPPLIGANEGAVFSEVWYASPMCASTMQSYHMARILLLINMPQHSTLGRTTAFKRIASYKSVAADTEYHSRAICSIASGRADASARINSVQPLFLAGQFLEKQVERAEILRLLREIQDDTGWATDYRVKQLMDIWGWDSGSSPTGLP